jgi:hypothetical protein
VLPLAQSHRWEGENFGQRIWVILGTPLGTTLGTWGISLGTYGNRLGAHDGILGSWFKRGALPQF